jgi:thiamine kinase-like enzyme
MFITELELKHEIAQFFKVQKSEITNFRKLEGSNIVYSFFVKDQQYVIRKLIDNSPINWKIERDTYKALKKLNITDELVYCNNSIKIAKYLHNSKPLTFNKPDIIDSLDLIRMVHESKASIKYDYNICENIKKYISLCDKKSEKLRELKSFQTKIDAIQTKLNKLNIPKVLCHGDACLSTNFLRLPDGSIKIIDWEQAGMADPFLDIAISALHQGFKNIDPVWCLHHYLKRVPKKQEYLRLFSFLALDSFSWMAWCVYENSDKEYEYFLKIAIQYSDLVLDYY